MELNEILSYTDKFSTKAFAEKISRIAKRAGSKLVYSALTLFYGLGSEKITTKDKALIIGALGYLICPLDVVPDAIPLGGLTDDLAVLLFVLKKVYGAIDDDAKSKAKSRLTKWFDEDETTGSDNIFEQNPGDTPV